MSSEATLKQTIMNAVLAGAHAQRLLDAEKTAEAGKLLGNLSSVIDKRTVDYLLHRIIQRA